MREGWKEVSFEKSIEKVKKQTSVKSKDYKEKGLFPIVSQESSLISGYYDDETLLYQHQKPVVIFGDHTKNIKYIDFDFIVGADGVHILSPIKELNPKFFYYQLCSIKLRHLGYARHYKLLKECNIAIPSLEEQHRIVELLDAEFAKIDAIKANAEKQLQDAKDYYEKELDLLLRPKEYWESYKLGDCFITINNGANIKQIKEASGIPITRIETLSKGVFNADRLGYANIDNPSKYERYILRDGDLLMSHINSVDFVGRTIVYHNQLPILIHGMNLLRLVPNDVALSDFYYYLFKSKWVKSQIRAITHKSVNQASLNTTALKQIDLFVPKKEEQLYIISKLNKLDELCMSLLFNFEKTITLCNDLKQSILKDIFG